MCLLYSQTRYMVYVVLLPVNSRLLPLYYFYQLRSALYCTFFVICTCTAYQMHTIDSLSIHGTERDPILLLVKTLPSHHVASKPRPLLTSSISDPTPSPFHEGHHHP